MRATFAIAALAGSALAVPHYGRPVYQDTKEVENVHVVVETVVATVYVTDDGSYAAPTPTPEPEYEAPAVTTIVYEAPAAPSDTYEAPTEPSYAAPAPTSAAYAPAPTSSGYMAVVDTWRAKLGKKALVHDDKLEANAMDCVKSSNGQMVHKLNPGSYGQVLAPGNADDFEHVFVGGWLCEMPNMAGLDGVCATQSSGWRYDGQTGHAKILTDDSYSKIGCALYAGIWGCDVA